MNCSINSFSVLVEYFDTTFTFVDPNDILDIPNEGKSRRRSYDEVSARSRDFLESVIQTLSN